MKTDRELLPYVRQFEKESGTKVNYPVYFVRNFDKPFVVGRCLYASYMFGRVGLEVQIKKSTWLLMTEDERKVLIYHELGHCSLGLGHDERLYVDKCPISGMAPYIPNSFCMARYGAEYYMKTIVGK